jgi:hypothetical protein
MKTPVPITLPITRAIVSVAERPRTNSGVAAAAGRGGAGESNEGFTTNVLRHERFEGNPGENTDGGDADQRSSFGFRLEARARGLLGWPKMRFSQWRSRLRIGRGKQVMNPTLRSFGSFQADLAFRYQSSP